MIVLCYKTKVISIIVTIYNFIINFISFELIYYVINISTILSFMIFKGSIIMFLLIY